MEDGDDEDEGSEGIGSVSFEIPDGEPLPPLPEEEKVPPPSDEELDALFREIDRAFVEHPLYQGFRQAIHGVNVYTERHGALIDLLVQQGVLQDTAHVAYEKILEERVTASNNDGLRQIVGLAANGLFKVNGTPIPPDDLIPILNIFFGDEGSQRPGEASRPFFLSQIGKDRLGHFYRYMQGEGDLLTKIFGYVGAERGRARVAKLQKEHEENIKAMRKAGLVGTTRGPRPLVAVPMCGPPPSRQAVLPTIEQRAEAIYQRQVDLTLEIDRLMKDIKPETPADVVAKALDRIELHRSSIEFMIGELRKLVAERAKAADAAP